MTVRGPFAWLYAVTDSGHGDLVTAAIPCSESWDPPALAMEGRAAPGYWLLIHKQGALHPQVRTAGSFSGLIIESSCLFPTFLLSLEKSLSSDRFFWDMYFVTSSTFIQRNFKNANDAIMLFQNSVSESETGGLCSFGPSLEHGAWQDDSWCCWLMAIWVFWSTEPHYYTWETPALSPVSGWWTWIMFYGWILDHDSDALYSSHSGPTKHCPTHKTTKIYYHIIKKPCNQISPSKG